MAAPVKVLLFGRLAEIAGARVLEYRATDTDGLFAALCADFPEMDRHTTAMAVNRAAIRENTLLNPGDEVALLPPYSGG